MLAAPISSCRALSPAAAAAAKTTRRRRMAVSASAWRTRREEAVGRMPRLAHREVMLAVAGEAEARLGERLLPSEVPADVKWFENAAGDAVGSVDVRRGAPGSSIAFMLDAWFHRDLPGSGAIDITALIINLTGVTDAPHLVMEFIQGTPTSLIVLLDLLPRRDLPLHPAYIDRYYAATSLDARGRQGFADRVPQSRPYVSPSLLIRSLWSPAAVVADIQCGEGGEETLEGIVCGQVASTAMDVLGVWLEHCAGGEEMEMDKTERERIVARDRKVSATELELNLAANLPRMFDADVSDRVVAEIRKAFVAHREVARALASQAEARLGARLLPSAVPPDVAEFRAGAGNAVGSLDVRRGAPGSTIDFTFQSSLHCKVPNGAIDITTLLLFLNASTDAPHFLMELIQGSPTSIVVILDLIPRKDLALHPEYIENAWSPTAILVSIDCGQGGECTLEEIVRGQLATVAKELLQIWLDSCADHASEMEEAERESMIKRDQIVRSKSIEVDLTSNLPRMFDQDVANRVIAEIRKAFGVQDV
uniref:Red chlorophyll catabolite reductase n=1 Tax=Leersia perrieri TaxID=77586 RepID=A0A0D9XJ81_9ORYZ